MSDAPSLTPVDTSIDSAAESLVTSQPTTSEGAQAAPSEGSDIANAEAAAVEAGTTQTSEEAYADLQVPEGFETLDEGLMAEVIPMFKEQGFTKDQAQAAINLYASKVQAREQEQMSAFNQLMDDWRNQSINDKEFGGDHFEQSIGIARSALDKFGTPELKTLLEEHGVGNHPEVIRFMVKVGRLTQEDRPGANGAPISEKKDRASILYGS